jgi:hypothetical protein
MKTYCPKQGGTQHRGTKTIKTSIVHIEIEKQKNEKLLFFYFPIFEE